jgi:putative oxidoreductase
MFADPDKADQRRAAIGLDVPVLFTWAMQDRINRFKASEATIARMKQACVVKFNGGHAAFLEQPRQFVAESDRFIAESADAALRVPSRAGRSPVTSRAVINCLKQPMGELDMSGLINFLGRALIALLFVPAGIAKFATPGPFLKHMAAHGVPGVLLPLVGLFEVVAGLLILTGLFTRYAAAALGLFCVATAAIFHLNFADHAERTLFLKDLAIAGGLFVLATSWPIGRYLEDAAFVGAQAGRDTRLGAS